MRLSRRGASPLIHRDSQHGRQSQERLECGLLLLELQERTRERELELRRVVFGTNAKDVNRAVHMMIDKLNEMHLTVKPNWRVYKLSDSVFVDVLGVRIYRDRVTIRQHVFLKVRRTFKKARRAMYPALAKRIISYWGILKHTSSYVLRKRLKAPRYVKEARRLISRESTIRREAETA